MIEETLRLVSTELDQSLRRRFPGAPSLVALTNLVDPTGAPVLEAADRVAMFLVNVEREIIPARAPRYVDTGPGPIGIIRPPVHLNLMVMFAASPSGVTYAEALKQIEGVISFFQARPLFTAANLPDLDPAVEQLSVEIENLSITELSNLWGILGGRYMPSVLYRFRMLTIDAEQLEVRRERVNRVLAGAGQDRGG
jgi:hypothetical protein